MTTAYDAGEVDAIFVAQGSIVQEIPNLSNPDNQRFLDEAIARTTLTLTLVVDENQSEWADVVNWVNYTLIQAEEFGITSENVDDFLDSDDPEIRQFLGLERNFQFICMLKVPLNNFVACCDRLPLIPVFRPHTISLLSTIIS